MSIGSGLRAPLKMKSGREFMTPSVGLVTQKRRDTGGQQDRRGLADAAGDAEDQRGRETGSGRREDDVPHRAPAARPERQAGFAEATRNDAQDHVGRRGR